jgi:programmed cell death 6-interacting protein
MFADDLMIIDRLRSEAVNVQEPHISGISRLVTYAAQLKWLGGKFPIDVRDSPDPPNHLAWWDCG